MFGIRTPTFYSMFCNFFDVVYPGKIYFFGPNGLNHLGTVAVPPVSFSVPLSLVLAAEVDGCAEGLVVESSLGFLTD